MAIRRFEIKGKLISSQPATVDPGPSGEYAVDSVNGTAGFQVALSTLGYTTDSKVGIFSCWVAYNSTAGASQILFTVDANNSENAVLQINTNASRNLGVTSRIAALSTMPFNFTSSFAFPTGTDWYHVLLSWDVDNSLFHVYIDDVDRVAGSLTLNDAAIGYSRADEKINIMETDLIGAPWMECISQLYFNPEEYLDITVEANRRKFISASGEVVALGPTGTKPTGNQPVLYLDNPASSFHLNRGWGSDVDVYDAVTNPVDCADNPPGGA